MTAPRYAPAAIAEPPNSSRRIRTRPLIPLARSIREAANPQQPVDGPRATIRAAPPPAAHAPPNASAVTARHATPTAPQVLRRRTARGLSAPGALPDPDIGHAFPPVSRTQGLPQPSVPFSNRKDLAQAPNGTVGSFTRTAYSTRGAQSCPSPLAAIGLNAGHGGQVNGLRRTGFRNLEPAGSPEPAPQGRNRRPHSPMARRAPPAHSGASCNGQFVLRPSPTAPARTPSLRLATHFVTPRGKRSWEKPPYVWLSCSPHARNG